MHERLLSPAPPQPMPSLPQRRPQTMACALLDYPSPPACCLGLCTHTHGRGLHTSVSPCHQEVPHNRSGLKASNLSNTLMLLKHLTVKTQMNQCNLIVPRRTGLEVKRWKCTGNFSPEKGRAPAASRGLWWPLSLHRMRFSCLLCHKQWALLSLQTA